jgi:hypothetical protein
MDVTGAIFLQASRFMRCQAAVLGICEPKALRNSAASLVGRMWSNQSASNIANLASPTHTCRRQVIAGIPVRI